MQNKVSTEKKLAPNAGGLAHAARRPARRPRCWRARANDDADVAATSGNRISRAVRVVAALVAGAIPVVRNQLDDGGAMARWLRSAPMARQTATTARNSGAGARTVALNGRRGQSGDRCGARESGEAYHKRTA